MTRSCFLSADADNDGVPNRLDADSDDDGYTDAEEGQVDEDGDGVEAYVDADEHPVEDTGDSAVDDTAGIIDSGAWKGGGGCACATGVNREGSDPFAVLGLGLVVMGWGVRRRG